MPPKTPLKGTVRSYDVACCQSTVPNTTGTAAERKASVAEPIAISFTTLAVRATPDRFRAVKASTITIARPVTGSWGRYQWCSADALSRAVRPHVGTHPHQ